MYRERDMCIYIYIHIYVYDNAKSNDVVNLAAPKNNDYISSHR